MRGYRTFVKKEFMENLRTHKLFIMIVVFFIFGIMSPLFAKLTPQLLASLSEANGIEIPLHLPEPSALDSYTQFFKNIGQMGLIILLLVFSGTLSSEISKGTLIPVLTRGLSRASVIMAKFTVASFIWTLCYLLSFLVTFGYTITLFPAMDLHHLALSVLAAWLFGIFLLALFLLMSCAARGSYGGLLGTAVVFGLLLLGQMLPGIQKFNPIVLINDNVSMLKEGYVLSDMISAIIVTGSCIVIFMFSAITIFKRKHL